MGSVGKASVGRGARGLWWTSLQEAEAVCRQIGRFLFLLSLSLLSMFLVRYTKLALVFQRTVK